MPAKLFQLQKYVLVVGFAAFLLTIGIGYYVYNLSPYVIRKPPEIISRLTNSIPGLGDQVDIVSAKHSTEHNAFGNFAFSYYEVDTVWKQDLENAADGQAVLDVGKDVFSSLLDLIDEDKRIADYGEGRGGISFRIHATSETYREYRNHRRSLEAYRNQNRGMTGEDAPRLEDEFKPLISYTSSGEREWMERDLEGEETSSVSMFVSSRIEALISGLEWSPPTPQSPTSSVPIDVVDAELDPRLIGTWKAADKQVDQITMKASGEALTVLKRKDKYPEGIRSDIAMQRWDGKSILLMRVMVGERTETQAMEIDFPSINVLRAKKRHYPPDRELERRSLFIPEGFAYARMASDGTVDPEDLENVDRINSQFGLEGAKQTKD